MSGIICMMNTLSFIKTLLIQPRYAMIAAISSVGFGLLHYFLSLSLLNQHLDLVFGSMPIYIITSLVLSCLVAILAGINVSAAIFRLKSNAGMKRTGSSFLSGIFAVYTPGCPACMTPIAVVFGTVGGLLALPLQGLELKFISIGALLFSIYWISRKMNTCTTKSNSVEKCNCAKLPQDAKTSNSI